MHRFRSWTLDPPEWRTQRNRALSLEGGDGSALNVDFTTGVLDPKLSHSRGSNATFINSSGLVEFAPANRLANSVWSGAGGATYPTAWSGSIGVPSGQTSPGFLTLSGEVLRFTSATGTSGAFRTWIAHVPTIESGLTHTLSVQVVGRNANAAMPLAEILTYSGTSTSSKFYINGSDVLPPERGGGAITGATTAWQAGDLLSLVVVGAINGGSIRCGYGVTGGGGQTWSNEWVELTQPQWQPGAVPSRGVYWRNPSTTGQRFDSPRFDYNPTTLESNGLLIEGNASNLITYSDCSTTGWTGVNLTGSNNNATSPDGTTTATLWTGQGVSSNRAYSATLNVTNGSTYTVSAWFKKPPSNGSRYVKIYLLSFTETAIGWPSDGVLDLNTGIASGTGFTVTAYNDGWYRVVSTGTVNSTTQARVFIAMCTSTGGLLTTTESMLAWGAQAELGNGASSYIPTGSSSITRVNDSVTFNDFNWFTTWTSTWFADYKIFNCAGTPNQFYARSVTAPTSNLFYVGTNSSNSTVRPISRTYSSGTLQWNEAYPILSSTSEFNKCAWVVDSVAKIAHAGVVDYTSTSGRAVPLGSGLSAFEIALNPTAGTSCSMWLRSLKYYPKALNNVELVNLTKPTIPNTSLDLDFTSGTLSSLLTFTRGSNATFINSSGFVEWANSNMALRSDIMQTTVDGVSDGTQWNPGVGYTVSLVSTTRPDGSTGNVRRLQNTTGAGSFFNAAPISVIPGQRYTFSFWARNNGGSQARIRVWNNTASSPIIDHTQPENNYVGDIGGAGNTSTTWVRIFRTFVIPAGCNAISIYPSSHDSGTVDLYVFGAQLNYGSIPGTYLSTTNSINGNTPRFDYDPTSIGTPRGLLIESSANNLAFRSNTLNVISANEWINANCLTPSIASPAITDPSGGTDTWKVIAATGSGIHSWRNGMGGSTMTAGTAYTISVWAKPAEYDRIIISDPGAGTAACTFLMQGSGTATAINNTGIGTCTNPTMVPYKDGWWRCSATFTRVDGVSAIRSFGVAGYPSGATTSAFGATYNGDGTSGVYVYGWMMETGSGASSYIPTGASQGTRNADNCVTAIGNLTGFNANQGTIYESWRDNTASDTTTVQEWAFAFGTSGANGCGVHISNAASGTFGLSGGVSNTGDAGPAGTYVIQGVNKAAIAINVAATSLRLSANGSAVFAGTNILGYNGAQTFAIGQRNNNTRYLNGWISQFKYWPTSLVNNQLKYLSGS